MADKELDMCGGIQEMNNRKRAKRNLFGKDVRTDEEDKAMMLGCIEIMKGKF